MVDDRHASAVAAVSSWFAAIADGDAQRVGALMTASARDALAAAVGAANAAEASRRVAEAIGADGRARLRRMAPERMTFTAPDAAIATLEGGYELGLRAEGDRWLISELMTTARTGTTGAYPPAPPAFAGPPPRRESGGVDATPPDPASASIG